ncbi:MAG: outer membrane protein [Stellaceae bacterium]
MRAVALLAVSVAATLAALTSAQAEGPWYVSGSVGGYFREEATGTETFKSGGVLAPGATAETFDPGIIANLALGHQLPARFRIEAELGYAHYDDQKLNLSNNAFPALNGDFNPRSGADRSRYMGSINLFYDLPDIGRFVPYIGAGLGGAHGEASRGTFIGDNGVTFTQRFATNFTAGMALAEGGISINIDKNLAVVPAYRYVRFFGFNSSNGPEVAHVAKLGLRYSF